MESSRGKQVYSLQTLGGNLSSLQLITLSVLQYVKCIHLPSGGAAAPVEAKSWSWSDALCHLTCANSFLLDFEKREEGWFKGVSRLLIAPSGLDSIGRSILSAYSSELMPPEFSLWTQCQFHPHLMFWEDLISRWGNTDWSLILSVASDLGCLFNHSAYFFCSAFPTHSSDVCQSTVGWTYCDCCLGQLCGQWTEGPSVSCPVLHGEHVNLSGS